MKLYHGSNKIICEPEIITSSRLLDYGNGFYTTTSARQAEMWVRRKFKREGGPGYINCYDYDEKISVSHSTCARIIIIQQRQANRLMNLEVTQDNLYLFLPGKTSRMAQIYAEEHGVGIIEALRKVYHSQTYKELEEEDTKFWHLGPVALYQELMEED